MRIQKPHRVRAARPSPGTPPPTKVAPDRLTADLGYFLNHLDPQPTRLHRRGVWSDRDGGSALGSPALDPDFERWLSAPDRSTVVEPGLTERYRWPARAAIAKLAREPVPASYPDRAQTLRAIARCGGDLDRAATILAPRFPAMGDPESARTHFARALRRFAAIFRLERQRPAQAAEVAA